MPFAYRSYPALQYNGNNGQAICDLWNAGEHWPGNNWAVTSETGGVLTVAYTQLWEDGTGQNDIVVIFQTGDWVVGQEYVSATDYIAKFRTVIE